MGAPPESQPASVSPYPLPEEQSRTKPSGLVAWLRSAWDFLVGWFGGGTQKAQAAGFSATMLEVGVGFVQYEKHRKFENCNMEFFCDQPYDNWWVLFGMHLY